MKLGLEVEIATDAFLFFKLSGRLLSVRKDIREDGCLSKQALEEALDMVDFLHDHGKHDLAHWYDDVVSAYAEEYGVSA